MGVAGDTSTVSPPCHVPADRQRLLTGILKSVSRSFYLSIRVLPRGMREPVAVAYLLARAADTIADTRALLPSERLEHLRAFRAQVHGPVDPEAVGEIVRCVEARPEGIDASERTLLRNAGPVLRLLESLPDEDREQVRRVVETLTGGMVLDLETFPAEDSGEMDALSTPDDLDRYTYLVAGCVGEFWTAVAMAHEPRLSGWDADEISALGVRFGKALQLTNVLRDVPRDLRMGRCYLPSDDLTAAGLVPEDLLSPGNGERARAVLDPWIGIALGHYDAAETYLLSTPRRCVRLRLAALWPILLGLATLARLARNESWLDPAHPSRVRRRWVYGMMARSVAMATSDSLLRRWIHGMRRDVEIALRGN